MNKIYVFLVVVVVGASAMTYSAIKRESKERVCVEEDFHPWVWFEDTPECIEALGSLNRGSFDGDEELFEKTCYKDVKIAFGCVMKERPS